MDHNTGKIKQITHTKAEMGSTMAAPFNNGIYYVSDRDGENLEVYYMDLQGKVTQITHTAAGVVKL